MTVPNYMGNREVYRAQQILNQLGYTDARGRRLVEDGVWGPNTQAALGKFYAEKFSTSAPASITTSVLNTLSAELMKEGLDLTAPPAPPVSPISIVAPPPVPLPVDQKPPAPAAKPGGTKSIPPVVWAILGFLAYNWLYKKIPAKGASTALAGYRRGRR